MRKILNVIISIVLFSSCAVRSVFVPNSQNIMLFDGQKQIQANSYIGINTTQIQVAHNPVNHFVGGLSTNFGTGLSIYEGYLGLYNYSKNNNAKWRYEVLGGAGATNNFSKVGNAWITWFSNTKTNYETESVYNKYFLQPAFGYFSKIEMYKLNYSFAISCRSSYIDFKRYIYHEINEEETNKTGVTTYLVNKEYYNKDLYLFEPSITNKVGMKNIYGVLQAEVMMPYSKEIDIRYTKFSPVFLFSLGIQYNLVFKKRKDPKQ